MRHVRTLTILVAVHATLLSAGPAAAQDKIRDNLFLLEEAYNQEPGVIQHIQSLQLAPRTGMWSYVFTEEWPVPRDRHQLSLSFTALRPEPTGGAAIGDLLLNYRLQILGAGGAGWLAMAPRLSLVLPTGDWRSGAGRGAFGVQANVPVSIELGSAFVLHANAGATIVPSARSPAGVESRVPLVDASLGVAFVWLATAGFNALVEAVYLSSQNVLDDGSTARAGAWTINPGVRFALDFPSLQVVPGVSAPIVVGDEGTEVTVLVYLSFEHEAWRAGGEARGSPR